MKLSLVVIGLLFLIVPGMALTYENMARFPDQNIGQTITVTGEVNQVDYTSDGWAVRLITGRSEYGYYSGDDLFVYFFGTPTSSRVLEDDIIQVTGVFAGPFEYTTIFGATREVPLITGTSYFINPISAKY